jgi:hypothetical protein
MLRKSVAGVVPIQYQCLARMPYSYAAAAHQFERAQIGGQETQARHSGGHPAAGREKILAELANRFR